MIALKLYEPLSPFLALGVPYPAWRPQEAHCHWGKSSWVLASHPAPANTPPLSLLCYHWDTLFFTLALLPSTSSILPCMSLYHACNSFLSCFYSCPPSSFLVYDMPSQTLYVLSWELHRFCPCLDLSHFPCMCSVLWLLYLSATFIILSQMSYTLDALFEWVLYSNLDKYSLQGCSPGCVLSNCISTGLLLSQPIWFLVLWISSHWK